MYGQMQGTCGTLETCRKMTAHEATTQAKAEADAKTMCHYVEATPAPQSPIAEQILLHEASIYRLADIVNNLENRLSPVLSASAPENGATGGNMPVSQNSFVHDRLREETACIHSLADKLMGLTSRLEI